MSDATPDNCAVPSAQDIRTRAAAWLERRERGPWSDADQAVLEAWLSQSLSHRTAYWRVADAWDRADRLRALSSPAHEAEAAAVKISLPKILAGAAAIAIVVMTGVTTVNYLLAPREQTYATAIGGHRTVALADGSRIELNTNTSLRVAMSADRRIVSLDRGEAFFEVRHDARHPFMVMVGDHRVTDIGTKFLVRRDVERLEVAVVEGRVRFDAAGGPAQAKSALLAAGDDVVATPNTVFVTNRPVRKMAEELGWRQGQLIFDHTTLADAAAEFNRYNRRKLVIADSTVANITIDGTFPTRDVEAFTDVVQHILRLHVEGYEDEIAISR